MKGGALAQKEAQEKDWTPGSPPIPRGRRSTATCCRPCAALQAEGEKARERNAALGTLSSARPYLSAAQTLYRLSIQRPKKRSRPRRRLSRNATGAASARARTACSARIDAAADRAFLRWALGLAAALPAGQRIEPLDKAVGLRRGTWPRPMPDNAIDACLDKLYAGHQAGRPGLPARR